MSAAADAPAAVAAPCAVVESTRLLRVSPSVPRPSGPVTLGPNDWVLPPSSTVSLLFFYAPPCGLSPSEASTRFLPAAQLADALEQLVQLYPHTAGRLVPSKTRQGALDLDGFDHGVPFVVARSAERLADLALTADRYTSTASLPQELRLVQAMDYAAPLSTPLFAVQHTRFADGGVCLGVFLHHVLGDAHSFFQLVRDWADLYRSGATTLTRSPPPQLSREWSIPTPEQVRARSSSGLVERAYAVPDEGEPAPEWWSPAPARSRVYRLHPAELRAIKQAAQAEADARAEAGEAAKSVSTFEALVAHAMRLMHRARRTRDAQVEAVKAGRSKEEATPTADESKPTKMLIATNYRKRRVHPQCNARYFGNAAYWTACEVASSELLRDGSLPATAAAVHDALVQNDAAQLNGTSAWIASVKDVSRIHWASHGRTDFFSTQWNKMCAYSSSEFEPGHRPVRVCLPASPGMDGAIVLLGCPDEPDYVEEGDASVAQTTAIDVLIGLEEKAMDIFEADPEWRQFSQAK